MASWKQWMKALEAAGLSKRSASNLSTVETYSHLRSLGLKTVEWLSFVPRDLEAVEKMKIETKSFVQKNAPCLFIFEPLPVAAEKGLKKDYLFGVQKFSEIEEWLEKKQQRALDFSYLITTQITNPGFGFVGSVFSNGKGDLVCETFHRKGVSNHRKLSQSSENISSELDFFVVHDFELVSQRTHFLSYDQIQSIARTFSHLDGYFEFTYGEQLGERGIFSTGFMPSSSTHFPLQLWENEFRNPRNRFHALARKSNLY